MKESVKRTCISNIYFLAKRNGIKIGDIEARAELSAGYISRLSKEDNKTPLSLDMVLAASELFEVSVESLLTCNFEAMTSTQDFLLRFIDKLITDTEMNKLRWNCETADFLNSMECDINGQVPHPLFDYIETWTPGETEYPDKISRAVFASRAFGNTTVISDNCFNLKMKNCSTLYIMKVKDDDGRRNSREAIEFWMFKSGHGRLEYLCDDSDDILRDSIDRLYEVLQEDAKHPKMDDSVKSAIDAFMNDDLGSDDDTPF